MERIKKLASQLGKKIPSPGKYMPHFATDMLKKKRAKPMSPKSAQNAG